jgi:hypothetical protein
MLSFTFQPGLLNHLKQRSGLMSHLMFNCSSSLAMLFLAVPLLPPVAANIYTG